MAKKCTSCGAEMAWRPFQKPICGACQNRARAASGAGSSGGREASRPAADDGGGVLLLGMAAAESDRDSCRGSSYDGGGYDSGSSCDSGGSDSSSSWD